MPRLDDEAARLRASVAGLEDSSNTNVPKALSRCRTTGMEEGSLRA